MLLCVYVYVCMCAYECVRVYVRVYVRVCARVGCRERSTRTISQQSQLLWTELVPNCKAQSRLAGVGIKKLRKNRDVEVEEVRGCAS